MEKILWISFYIIVAAVEIILLVVGVHNFCQKPDLGHHLGPVTGLVRKRGRCL